MITVQIGDLCAWRRIAACGESWNSFPQCEGGRRSNTAHTVKHNYGDVHAAPANESSAAPFFVTSESHNCT
jgi:hypothetical protein